MNLQWMNVPTFITWNFFNLLKKTVYFIFIPLLKGLKLEPKLIKSVFFGGIFLSFFWKKKR